MDGGESFEEDRYELYADDGGEGFILLENNVEEKILLQGSGWQIGFDAEAGESFVQQGDREAEWCNDMFDHTVAERADGTKVVRTAEGVDYTLDEFRQRHKPIEIRIHGPGTPYGSCIDGAVLDQSVGGSFVLWSLASLYSIYVGRAFGTSSSWYWSWWPSWTKVEQNRP